MRSQGIWGTHRFEEKETVSSAIENATIKELGEPRHMPALQEVVEELSLAICLTVTPRDLSSLVC